MDNHCAPRLDLHLHPHEEAERRVEESNEVRIFVKIMHRGLYDTDV